MVEDQNQHIEKLSQLLTEFQAEIPGYRIGQAIVNSLNLSGVPELFYVNDDVLLTKLQLHRDETRGK